MFESSTKLLSVKPASLKPSASSEQLVSSGLNSSGGGSNLTLIDVNRLLEAQKEVFMAEIQKLQIQNAQLLAQISTLNERVAAIEKARPNV